MKMPTSTDEWLEISNDFYTMWQFPNCLGAIDGKHVVVRSPPNTGSLHYNHKGTFSVVLMALVDGNAKFRYIDVGAYGRNSDGGIFKSSSLGQALDQNLLHIPNDDSLPEVSDGERLPFVFLADEAFPLQRHIMRPYPGLHLSKEKQAFNYRLSRGRRIVENAFGILAQRFRVFHTKINLSLETVREVIKVTCLLHNLLRDDPSAIPIDTQSQGQNSQFTTMEHDMEPGTETAHQVRDKLRNFFVAYPLSWQNSYLNRGLRNQ